MLRISRPVILILAAVLILTACSGGDADLEAVDPEMVSELTISDGDQPTVTVTTTPTTTTVLAFSLDALNPAMDAGGVMTLLGDLACGLRADGGIKCWGTLPYFTGGLNNTWHQPSDSYIALSGSCGLRPDQTIRCWNGFDPPAGRFIAISHEGSWHACGIRVDQTVECWGDDEVESGRIGRCPSPKPDPATTKDKTATTRQPHLKALSRLSPPVGGIRAASEPTRPSNAGGEVISPTGIRGR